MPHAATPGEVPVGRHRDPDRRRRDRDERRGEPRRSSSANARTATTIAAAALDPTSRHSNPAHAPPPRPMRSSQTNVSSAPGGWPDTCVIHESGWKSRILRENAAQRLRDVGDASAPGADTRAAVSRPAKPRCQPSIIASENAHAQDVAHADPAAAPATAAAARAPAPTARRRARLASPVRCPSRRGPRAGRKSGQPRHARRNGLERADTTRCPSACGALRTRPQPGPARSQPQSLLDARSSRPGSPIDGQACRPRVVGVAVLCAAWQAIRGRARSGRRCRRRAVGHRGVGAA